MSKLELSQNAKKLLALKKQMEEMGVCTEEVQLKINDEFSEILDDIETKISLLNKQRDEILEYIIDPDEIQESKDKKIIPKKNEVKVIEIELKKEVAFKVKITEINSGILINNGKSIPVQFKYKQKVGQDAYVFEFYKSEIIWIKDHVLYVGTTYIDRKYGKLYIVTKNGIASVKLSVLEQYVVNFGKEILIGDGMSIVNPNFLKIKAGFDINFV